MVEHITREERHDTPAIRKNSTSIFWIINIIRRKTILIEDMEDIIRTKFLTILVVFSPADRFRQISVVELVLRFTVFTKYNLCRKTICRIIDRDVRNDVQKSYQINLDFSCDKVTLTSIEDRFRCDNIIVTILGNLWPKLFFNRFIPRQAKLLMVNSQLDLPLLEGLLL